MADRVDGKCFNCNLGVRLRIKSESNIFSCSDRIKDSKHNICVPATGNDTKAEIPVEIWNRV